MWPFTAKRDYSALEEEIRKLKRMVEERDLDWVDMRSRCKRLLDRTEKASRAMMERAEETEAVNGEGAQPQSTRFLTPHQRAIQQQILRRRATLTDDRG